MITNWDDIECVDPIQETNETAHLRNYDVSSMRYLRESIHEIKRASADINITATDPEISKKLCEIERTITEIETQLKYIPLKIKHLVTIEKNILLRDNLQTYRTECFYIDMDSCVFFELFNKNEKIHIKGFTKQIVEKIENFEPFGIDLSVTLIGNPPDEYMSGFNGKYWVYSLNNMAEFFQTEIFQVKDINDNFIVNESVYLEFTINEKIIIKTTAM